MGDAGSLIKRGFILLSLMGLVIFAGCSGGTAALKKDTALARLEKVDVVDSDTNTAVVLVLDRASSFTSVRLPDPPKVIVDLAGVDLGENREPVKVDKGPISYITPSTVPGAHRIARLEIGLTSAANSVTTQDGSTIRIMFEKPKPEADNLQAKTEPGPSEAPPAPAEKIQAADTAVEKPVGETAPAGQATAVTKEAAPPVKASAPAPAATVAATPSAPTPQPSMAVAAVPSTPAPAQKPSIVVSALPSTHSSNKAQSNLPAAKTVSGIGYTKSGDGYAVSIEGDGGFGKPGISRLGADRLVVDLPDMTSMKDKEIIEVGGNLLKRVRMAAHKETPKKVRVVLDVAGAFDYDVKSDGKTLVVSVFPAGDKTANKALPAATKAEAASKPETAPKAEAASKPEPAVKAAKTEAPAKAEPVQMAARKPVRAAAIPALNTAKAAAPVNIYISTLDGKTVLSSSPIEPGNAKGAEKSKGFVETPTKVYTGGRISFDIQDADLDNVMKLLADVAGLNLIMDPAEVRGKVTLKLDNVPWDQALDILLKIYNLDKVIDGNVLRIASKAKLDDEMRRDLLAVAEQKKLEQQAEDLYTKTFKINFTPAADLEPKVKKILSPRGDATANVRTNELIITDIKSNIEKAGQLITILDKEVRQIMIEARIVTVDVGYSRSLGVSWGLTRNGNGTGGPNFTINGGSSTQGATPTVGAVGKADTFQLNVPSALQAAAGGLLGGFSWGLLKEVNLDLTIEALEAINRAETLSAPKLMTLENQSATIAQGTTIYVQTTSAAGTKPEPLNANLSLTVTPRVTGDNFITMEVTATDNAPGTVPPGATAAIDTKSVTTNVLVKDGDTVVLGGIFTKSNFKSETRVPLLGRIPLIGWLFKQKTFNEPQNELMIFITPKLIRQVSAQV
jgi:type IV pilus assembly protein PilQ